VVEKDRGAKGEDAEGVAAVREREATAGICFDNVAVAVAVLMRPRLMGGEKTCRRIEPTMIDVELTAPLVVVVILGVLSIYLH
jgi:hypothetical protein